MGKSINCKLYRDGLCGEGGYTCHLVLPSGECDVQEKHEKPPPTPAPPSPKREHDVDLTIAQVKTLKLIRRAEEEIRDILNGLNFNVGDGNLRVTDIDLLIVATQPFEHTTIGSVTIKMEI